MSIITAKDSHGNPVHLGGQVNQTFSITLNGVPLTATVDGDEITIHDQLNTNLDEPAPPEAS